VCESPVSHATQEPANDAPENPERADDNGDLRDVFVVEPRQQRDAQVQSAIAPLQLVRADAPTIAMGFALTPATAKPLPPLPQSATSGQTIATTACRRTDASPSTAVSASQPAGPRPDRKVREPSRAWRKKSARFFRHWDRSPEPVRVRPPRRRRTGFPASGGRGEHPPAGFLPVHGSAAGCRRTRYSSLHSASSRAYRLRSGGPRHSSAGTVLRCCTRAIAPPAETRRRFRMACRGRVGRGTLRRCSRGSRTAESA
jgi:hypothetical protein